MKKITEWGHISSVNNLVLTKDHEKFISCSNDRTFRIWFLEYNFSIQNQRRVLEKCIFEKAIEDCCSIYALNSCHLNPNIVFTGGADCKIKMWNISTGICEREIVGHKVNLLTLTIFILKNF